MKQTNTVFSFSGTDISEQWHNLEIQTNCDFKQLEITITKTKTKNVAVIFEILFVRVFGVEKEIDQCTYIEPKSFSVYIKNTIPSIYVHLIMPL